MADFASLVKAVHDADAALAAAGDAADLSTTSPAVAHLRAAYDALLDEFPLCYGYWKRYADFELATGKGAVQRADALYERALVLGRYCVDLWSFYGTHATTHWANRADDVRALFERGAAYVGSDYAADAFWDRFVAFESGGAGADHTRVSALFRRQMQLPLRSLDALWLRFQQLAVERSCAELLDEREEAALQMQLEALGMAPPRLPACDAEDDGARKLRLLPLLEAQFKRARGEHAERLQWEEGVRRRYFHLQPLSADELAHWHAYLDWEEARGNVPRLVLTYERALVACCLDSRMWLRYVRALEGHGMIREARDAFTRASGHFLRRHPAMLLAHAAFEEAHHAVGAARRVCAAAAALRPPLVEAVLAQANLERRLGDVAAMRAAYTTGCALLAGDDLAFVVRHAGRYEAHVLTNRTWATELAEAALQREPTSEVLWDVRISHELLTMPTEHVAPAGTLDTAAESSSEGHPALPNGGQSAAAPTDGSATSPGTTHARTRAVPSALAHVYNLFERAIGAQSPLPDEAKLRLLRRYVQVAHDYSDSVASIRELTERLEHASSPKRQRTAAPDAPQPPHAAPYQQAAAYSAYQQAAAYSQYYAAAHAQQQQQYQSYAYAAYPAPAAGYYA